MRLSIRGKNQTLIYQESTSFHPFKQRQEYLLLVADVKSSEITQDL